MQGGSAGYRGQQKIDERVRWQAYSSWAHFAWLYGVSLIAGTRGLFALRSGISGWSIWLGGAVALLVCVALLRRWARYTFTTNRVTVSNGFTGRDIQTLSFDDLSEITILQGPLAQFLGIGTLVLRSVDRERMIFLRGVRDPEVIKTRLEALRA